MFNKILTIFLPLFFFTSCIGSSNRNLDVAKFKGGRCVVCDGKGKFNCSCESGQENCYQCGGRGVITKRTYSGKTKGLPFMPESCSASITFTIEESTCNNCSGSGETTCRKCKGKVEVECGRCDGTGRV